MGKTEILHAKCNEFLFLKGDSAFCAKSRRIKKKKRRKQRNQNCINFMLNKINVKGGEKVWYRVLKNLTKILENIENKGKINCGKLR